MCDCYSSKYSKKATQRNNNAHKLILKATQRIKSKNVWKKSQIQEQTSLSLKLQLENTSTKMQPPRVTQSSGSGTHPLVQFPARNHRRPVPGSDRLRCRSCCRAAWSASWWRRDAATASGSSPPICCPYPGRSHRPRSTTATPAPGRVRPDPVHRGGQPPYAGDPTRPPAPRWPWTASAGPRSSAWSSAAGAKWSIKWKKNIIKLII